MTADSRGLRTESVETQWNLFEGVKKLIDFDAASLPPSLGRVHPLITPRGRGSVNKTKKERGFLFGSLV